MNIKTQVREIEAHLNKLTTDKSEKIAILSKAQSMVNVETQQFDVLTIAKRRLIRNF